MLNCTYIVNNKEYSHEEFKKLILTKGMGILLKGVESPSELAKSLVERYDVTKMNESIMEMWARIELEKQGEKIDGYISEQKANDVLNAKGQLTDYATQEQIRYNTYSGIALTGIVANFSKVIGYLFDSTPPTQVTDTETGAVFAANSAEFKALLKANDAPTVERLIEKKPNYKISGRELPKLKKFSGAKNKEAFVKINGNELNAFRRTAFDGSIVFETIDTLINLAIDNVKMQKLHLLGITNVNSNSFLALIGMGVPLNTASKMFKMPVISKISEGRRWGKDFLTDKQEEITVDILNTIDTNQIADAIIRWYPELESQREGIKNIKSKESLIETVNGALFSNYDFSLTDELLEKGYKGELDPAEQYLLDMALLKIMDQVLPVGMEMFKHSMIYKGLRFLPNKMWQLTSLIDNIESLSHFKGEAAGTRRQVSSVAQEVLIKTIIENNPELFSDSMTEEEKIDMASKMASEFVKEYSEALYTANNQVRANYVNRVIKKTTTRKVEPSGSSVFTNVAPLMLPHVRAMYRTSIAFRNLIEQIFNVYSPTVQKFVENVTKEANLFSAYDALDKSGEVSKEFIKFITSNLKFKIGDEFVTTYVEGKHNYETPDGTVTGAHAWARNFVDTLFRVHSDIDTNDFLNALEFTTRDGVQKVMIVADKINDDEVIEKLRDGFEQLYRTKEIKLANGQTISGKQLALDLFKYSLMTDSMYYEKTGFSLIFPPAWGIAFASAFSARVESVIPKDSYTTDLNLMSIKSLFLYQFLRARPDIVGSFSGGKAVKTKQKLPGNNKTKTVYNGKDIYQNRVIHYDIKFNATYSVLKPKFITGFNGELLALVPTPESPFCYYVKIASADSPIYDFSNQDLDRKFKLDLLTNGYGRLVDSKKISGNVLIAKHGDITLEQGDIVKAVDMDSVSPSDIYYYQVVNVSTNNNGNRYTLVSVGSESLFDTQEIQRAKTQFSKFFNIRTGSTIIVDTIAQLKRPEKGGKEITTITISPTEGDFELPFFKIGTEEKTDKQLQDILDETRQALNTIPNTATVVITKDIFDGIKRYAMLWKGLSNLFYEKFNYVDPFAVPTKAVEKSPQLVIALKEQELGVQRMDKFTKITRTNEGLFLMNTTDALSKVKEGDLFYAGNKTYYFAVANEGGTISMLQFPEAVLLEMDKGMDVVEFTKLYNEINKC